MSGGSWKSSVIAPADILTTYWPRLITYSCLILTKPRPKMHPLKMLLMGVSLSAQHAAVKPESEHRCPYKSQALLTIA
jgi:hypothetical protein